MRLDECMTRTSGQRQTSTPEKLQSVLRSNGSLRFPESQSMHHFNWIFPLRTATGTALTALLVSACSSAEDASDPNAGGGGFYGVGGSWTGTGGAFGSTGGSAANGVGGTSPTGGAFGNGGIVGVGGVVAGGGSGFGGTPASGGTSSGGVPSTGGDANGGASTGGVGAGGTATGGAQGDGGSATGGAGTGGAPPALKKFVGNITTGGQVRSDFINYWDQITPENEGKWGSVEGTRDQMNWGGLDRVHDYAKQHGIPFKQHNFVWGAQQPNWIGGLSQSDQRAEVEEWIQQFCQRYPDTQMIDVVNEPPPHTTPVYTAALGGAGASGYDWIVQAFKWARQYCPNAILILNDYNTIEYGNDNTHFIDIVNKIKGAGAPIDAIGAQAHAAYGISTNTVKGFLDKLTSSTGLPVYISEYDINLSNDTQQRDVMESQFTMFWNDDNVKGITLWGYVVGQTWLANTGLMTSSGQQRPAMTWLMQFLNR
jgi:endo-1,4-beta-xylanase